MASVLSQTNISNPRGEVNLSPASRPVIPLLALFNTLYSHLDSQAFAPYMTSASDIIVIKELHLWRLHEDCETACCVRERDMRETDRQDKAIDLHESDMPVHMKINHRSKVPITLQNRQQKLT